MIPAASPTWARISSIIPRASRPKPRAARGAPRNPAARPPRMPPTNFPMNPIALTSMMRGRDAPVRVNCNPTNPKKTGVRRPKLTADMDRRIWLNRAHPTSCRLPPRPRAGPGPRILSHRNHGVASRRTMALKDKLRIGCSGWGYDDWLDSFYPKDTPKSDYLPLYSSVLDCVEVDSSFYRNPGPATTKAWYKATPPGFLFTMKMPKRITHEKKLRQVTEQLGWFYASAK